VRALNNDPGERVARGVLRMENGSIAHWDFNDINVSAARDPENKLHFWVQVDGLITRSSFWTHGLDARTYLPHPDVLLVSYQLNPCTKGKHFSPSPMGAPRPG
jgi:hypothetical protein